MRDNFNSRKGTTIGQPRSRECQQCLGIYVSLTQLLMEVPSMSKYHVTKINFFVRLL
jgi:hypothetical protein